jgi:hypothetical protein
MRWFVTPSRLPWTATPARYRAEELFLRAAIANYEDAAMGRPDAGARTRAAEDLTRATQVVQAGSQRVSLEELGPAVGAPDAGRSALLAGDRLTLLARSDEWDHWSVRLRTLEAALLEGDGPRAAALAHRYADFHPWDEDLRVAVAALLCLNDDPDRGGALLATVETQRAHDRHESWARNWGEVRALVVACAAKAGKAPPPPPEHLGAGVDDYPEARAVLRLKRVARTDPGDTLALRTTAFDVIQMLKEGPLAPGARVRVLAALLSSAHAIDENLAALLAVPHDGEAPLLPAAQSFTALDWLDEPRGLRPSPSRQALRHAADRLRRLASSTEISAEERLALETAATATAIEAARASALAGDGASAVEILDRAGPRSLPGSASARALLRSTAWYVAADPARALAEVEHEPADLPDLPALQAAWWIQKAELYASMGRRDEAARAAVLADEASVLAADRGLEVRARWTRVALARPPLSPLRADPPRPLPGQRLWPWVGEMATPSSWLAPDAESPLALDRALAFWDAARGAPPDQRRAIRYAAATAHRGDAPRARSAYLALGAQLLADGEGEVEVWLDAFSATAARAVTMRAYTWSRAEAARFRGDTEAASQWTRRYRTLVALAANPEDAEIAAVLGI